MSNRIRERRKLLDEWLEKHHARLMRTVTMKTGAPKGSERLRRVDSTLELWSLQGNVVIVQIWPNGGWDVYVSAGASTTDIEATLTQAERILEL